MRLRTTIHTCALLVCLGLCGSGFAQSDKDSSKNRAQAKDSARPDAKKSAGQKPVDKKPAPNVSKERRAELMAFVKKHHPEIRPLFNSLQKTHPSQFQATLRTLDREVRNLQALENRWPEKYQKSLEYWTTKSKVRLLSAQLAIKNSLPEQQTIEKKIFQLIQKQYELRIAIIGMDVTAAESRLDKYKSELAKLKDNRESDVNRQMDLIRTNSQRIRQKQAAEAKKKSTNSAKKSSPNKPPGKPKDNSRKGNLPNYQF